VVFTKAKFIWSSSGSALRSLGHSYQRFIVTTVSIFGAETAQFHKPEDNTPAHSMEGSA